MVFRNGIGRSQRFRLMYGTHVLRKRVRAREGPVAFYTLVSVKSRNQGSATVARRSAALTRQCAVERLFPCMAPHVRPQCIPAGVRNPLSVTVDPFASILLLPLADVVLMKMIY